MICSRTAGALQRSARFFHRTSCSQNTARRHSSETRNQLEICQDVIVQDFCGGINTLTATCNARMKCSLLHSSLSDTSSTRKHKQFSLGRYARAGYQQHRISCSELEVKTNAHSELQPSGDFMMSAVLLAADCLLIPHTSTSTMLDILSRLRSSFMVASSCVPQSTRVRVQCRKKPNTSGDTGTALILGYIPWNSSAVPPRISTHTLAAFLGWPLLGGIEARLCRCNAWLMCFY